MKTDSMLPIDRKNLPLLTGMVSRAFFEDPMFRAIIPDIQRREKILPGLMEPMLEYLRHTANAATNPEHSVVVCWTRTRKNAISIQSIIQSGILEIPFRAGLRVTSSLFRVQVVADKIHKKSVSGEHIYLDLLAVDPEVQGKGWGSQILEWIKAESVHGQIPLYLETTNPNALTFYQKHDMEITGSYTDRLGFTVWGVRYQPPPQPALSNHLM